MSPLRWRWPGQVGWGDLPPRFPGKAHVVWEFPSCRPLHTAGGGPGAFSCHSLGTSGGLSCHPCYTRDMGHLHPSCWQHLPSLVQGWLLEVISAGLKASRSGPPRAALKEDISSAKERGAEPMMLLDFWAQQGVLEAQMFPENAKLTFC